MKDPRVVTLARNLIRNAICLQAGEKVLIENYGFESPLVTALVEEAYAVGGQPFVWIKDMGVQRALLMGLSDEQADLMAEVESHLMDKVDCYLGIRSGDNKYAIADVPTEQNERYSKRVGTPVHDMIRIKQKRWCVLRYPSPSMAQLAGMSTEGFENFYFDVCNLDYSKMGKAMEALIARMERTDKVRIVGPNTDLSFSIKGMPAIPCAGQMNIPDGEVFTAPIRDSVNGVLTFNTPSVYEGITFENIRFEFNDGKIEEATSNHTERLNQILDMDEGSRYIGEFAIGVNPFINVAMKDTLFDEKIAGSFHFTPGQCYDEAPNGNNSTNHWDLVCIQTPECGGGEMYFDGELIRKDGRFVVEDLLCLNPENLI